MANEKAKNNLLSSMLDFEDMESIAPGAAKTGAAGRAGALPEAGAGQTSQGKPEEIKAPALASASARRTGPEREPKLDGRHAQARKKSVKTLKNEDKFTLYVVLVVILGMIIISIGIYSYTRTPRNAAGLNYVALPQIIISIDGQVARLQATVQIDVDDTQWLDENKNEVNAIFKKAINRMDPEELRSKNGFAAAQLALKEQLNTDMQSEKIQAVLLTELLVQDQN